jgi:hypothetical protein
METAIPKWEKDTFYFTCEACLDAYPYEQHYLVTRIDVMDHEYRHIPSLICPRCMALLSAGKPVIAV